MPYGLMGGIYAFHTSTDFKKRTHSGYFKGIKRELRGTLLNHEMRKDTPYHFVDFKEFEKVTGP